MLVIAKAKERVAQVVGVALEIVGRSGPHMSGP